MIRALKREKARRLLAAREKPNDFTAYRDRPVEFAREVLGAEPWERQEEILRALAREPRVTVRSCNGAGKTLCASWAVLWFLCSRPGSIVVTTAPTGRQVRDYLWRRIREAFSGARCPLPGRCLTQQIECAPNWYATGFSTDEEVKFQGPHSPHGVLFICDEASGVAEWLYQAASGFMTEPGAKMLLIGNPNSPSGGFYESHKRWPQAQKFHISAFDVPAHVLKPGWREEMLSDFGAESPVYQVRVLGEFPEQGEDSLISMRWVEAAQQRWIPPADADLHAEVEIGSDIARYGSDESVSYVRSGPRVLDAVGWRGQDTQASAGQIAALARQWQAVTIKVDGIGIGAGVVDALMVEGLPVIDVNVGESAWDSEHFANRRAEIFWGLRERFKTGDIAIPPDDDLLLDQLVSLKYSYTPRGQIKLESKEEMRKKRGQNQHWSSPDRADALALCFAVEQCFTGFALAGDPTGESLAPLGRAEGWKGTA
jgi:phage terminase large subunit